MAHRYFTEQISGGKAWINGPDAVHLARVLRSKPGEKVLLCDGAGYDYSAEIVTADPQCIELAVLEKTKSAAEPTLWAEVFIAMAKGERMDTAVQKSVELGASAIWPFFSQNTVVKPKNDEAKTTRFARIAAEAAKQCGRAILPEVHSPITFEEVLGRVAELDLSLFFYEEEGISITSALEGFSGTSVALITGAEGGFTPQEATAAQAAGCKRVHLGPRILRCETAPPTALAALMVLTGNLE